MFILTPIFLADAWMICASCGISRYLLPVSLTVKPSDGPPPPAAAWPSEILVPLRDASVGRRVDGANGESFPSDPNPPKSVLMIAGRSSVSASAWRTR